MSAEVKIIGANPIVRLFDGDEVTAAVSVWTVDWSVKGSGDVVVAWHDGDVQVIGLNTELARWLAEDFTRHFPEFADLPWSDATVLPLPVAIDIDLASGMSVMAGDVAVRTSTTMGCRQFSTDTFDVGGIDFGLTMVIAPQREAAVSVRGLPVPGEPRLSGTAQRPSSSAFLTAAEVWTLDE
jgi:hypothetical protein